MKPRASFVIPVKDGQAYVAQAIHSCLAQSTNRMEVVVVNDGSRDNTAKVLRFMADADDRVRVVELGDNHGRSKARNIGINEAKSDVILVLDADDIALSNRLADTMNYLKKNPAVDLVFGGFQVMDEFGSVLMTQESTPFDIDNAKKTRENRICHSTMAFTKRLFDKVQYTDGEFSTHGIDDWKFQMDAHNAGFNFGSIPKILSRYRYVQKSRDEKRIAELKAGVIQS